MVQTPPMRQTIVLGKVIMTRLMISEDIPNISQIVRNIFECKVLSAFCSRNAQAIEPLSFGEMEASY